MKAAPRDEFSKGSSATTTLSSFSIACCMWFIGIPLLEQMMFQENQDSVYYNYSRIFLVFINQQGLFAETLPHCRGGHVGSEWRLYDYITRHFISSLMPDVEYEEKDGLRTRPTFGDRNALLDLWILWAKIFTGNPWKQKGGTMAISFRSSSDL